MSFRNSFLLLLCFCLLFFSCTSDRDKIISYLEESNELQEENEILGALGKAEKAKAILDSTKKYCPQNIDSNIEFKVDSVLCVRLSCYIHDWPLYSYFAPSDTNSISVFRRWAHNNIESYRLRLITNNEKYLEAVRKRINWAIQCIDEAKKIDTNFNFKKLNWKKNYCPEISSKKYFIFKGSIVADVYNKAKNNPDLFHPPLYTNRVIDSCSQYRFEKAYNKYLESLAKIVTEENASYVTDSLLLSIEKNGTIVNSKIYTACKIISDNFSGNKIYGRQLPENAYLGGKKIDLSNNKDIKQLRYLITKTTKSREYGSQFYSRKKVQGYKQYMTIGLFDLKENKYIKSASLESKSPNFPTFINAGTNTVSGKFDKEELHRIYIQLAEYAK